MTLNIIQKHKVDTYLCQIDIFVYLYFISILDMIRFKFKGNQGQLFITLVTLESRELFQIR